MGRLHLNQEETNMINITTKDLKRVEKKLAEAYKQPEIDGKRICFLQATVNRYKTILNQEEGRR